MALSSFARKVAFALRFGELNPLISGQITPKSRRDLLPRHRRSVSARRRRSSNTTATRTPSSSTGGSSGSIDALHDDATTTRTRRAADTSRLAEQAAGSSPNFNYVRNSVKVDGRRVQRRCHVLPRRQERSGRRARTQGVPEACSPTATRCQRDLRAHLRYPEDLFRVQTTMFGRYHLDQPRRVLQRGRSVERGARSGHRRRQQHHPDDEHRQRRRCRSRKADDRMEPYYVLTKLPERQRRASSKSCSRSCPASSNDSRKNLTAFMVAKSDPGSYGKLEAYVMPAGQQVAGPVRDRVGDAVEPGGRASRDAAVARRVRRSSAATSSCCRSPTRSSRYVRLYVQA